MINQIYRLCATKQFRTEFVDFSLSDENVVVRPTYLSICAADQRYYTGSRGRVVMKQKLPMALIHEGVGEVIYDPKGEIAIGTQVAMVPNTPMEQDSVIKENYLRTSKFRASGFDGFMQSLVVMRRDLIVPFTVKANVAVLAELTSVAMNAIDTFEKKAHKRREVIGIWGNGNVGFVTALVLKKMYPDSKIIVFGVQEDKMDYFTFADETYIVNDIPEGLLIDHAFECVGGRASGVAINQIIDYIKPQGSIMLMGVSEANVEINTRMVLEKGLTLLGNSRSNVEDFRKSIELMEKYPEVCSYLSTIISEEIVVKNVADMHKAFERDLNNKFKTIMKWDV